MPRMSRKVLLSLLADPSGLYVTQREVEKAGPCVEGYLMACRALRVLPGKGSQYAKLLRSTTGRKRISPDKHIPLASFVRFEGAWMWIDWLLKSIPRLRALHTAMFRYAKYLREQNKSTIQKIDTQIGLLQRRKYAFPSVYAHINNIFASLIASLKKAPAR